MVGQRSKFRRFIAVTLLFPSFQRGVSMSRSVLAFVMLARFATAAAPVVDKVEPPDWPAGKSMTLRMLISGSGFSGATVRSSLQTGAVRVSSAGSHLFFDLTVPAGA